MKKSLFFILMAVCVLTISCSKNDSSDDGDDGGSTNGLKTGQVEMKVYPSSNKNMVTFKMTAKKVTIDWGDGNVEEHTPNGLEKSYVHEYSNQNFQTILINTDGMTSVFMGDKSSYGIGKFHELNLGSCPDLMKIDCVSQDLTRIDLGTCESLEIVDCYYNSQLTYINVSNARKLKTLDAYGTSKITELKVKNCISLEEILCNGLLTSLDISDCKALKYLGCGNNKLSETELNKIFGDLPTRVQADNARIAVWDNPGTSTCNKTIAENKGWEFVDY